MIIIAILYNFFILIMNSLKTLIIIRVRDNIIRIDIEKYNNLE